MNEPFFGPFPSKQFTIAAVGVIATVQVATYVSSPWMWPSVILIVGATYAIVVNNAPVVIDTRYIQMRKARSKTPEEFKRWVGVRLALLHAESHFRKERNLPPNPKSEELIALLEGEIKG